MNYHSAWHVNIAHSRDRGVAKRSGDEVDGRAALERMCGVAVAQPVG
jgi:hypothetical protein